VVISTYRIFVASCFKVSTVAIHLRPGFSWSAL
jgi:hypothetical protein